MKIRLEDIFIPAEHYSAAADAKGRMVVQTGHPAFGTGAIKALIGIERHGPSPSGKIFLRQRLCLN